MASGATDQNVVLRVANLSLVSSTCDMVSSAYISTKENHPYLKSACEMAEKGVKNITTVALTSAKPIIQKLEPQIALANNYACSGLDKIEEKLPILYQPAKLAASAKEAVAGTMVGAKDTVAHTVTGVMDKTKGVLQGSMEMTKAAVSGSMNTVLGSRMVQMVSTGVDTALTKSEALVDQYLPLTEEETAKEASTDKGPGTQKQSYYNRLGSLSSKIHRHAYERALAKVKDVKHRTQETISKLQSTIDLMTYANQKRLEGQEKLYQSWVALKRSTGQQDGEGACSREYIQWHALAVAQELSHQLKTNCLALVTSIRGFPFYIENKAHHIVCMAGDIYQNFYSVAPFGDVSDQILATSKGQLNKLKESLDEMMAYLANNIPLNWLVHICPQMKHEDRQEEQTQQQEGEHSS